MGEGAGGNCFLHFEKLWVAKLILPPSVFFALNLYKTRNVFITKYARLYKLSNGKKLYL
jgi:hypothetical protein